MDFPQPIIPESNLTAYLSRFHSATRALVPGGSDTIGFKSDVRGMVLEIQEHVLAPKNLVSGFDEYVDGNGYSINALVYVRNAKTYTDETGAAFHSIPGTYICVSPVPPKVKFDDLSNDFLRDYYSRTNQTEGIVYAPAVVVNDSRLPAYRTEDGKGKYWHLISPAVMITTTCDEAAGLTTYTAAQISG